MVWSSCRWPIYHAFFAGFTWFYSDFALAESGVADGEAKNEVSNGVKVNEIDSQPVVVTVRGRSRAERAMRSGQAVTVVELGEARGKAADLGEVVGRVPGVSVRREGGLGSQTRLSLNGLGGERVRFFLDGIPLARTGHALGLANVPIGLLERIEIYRGVVPVKFGADAVGGVINLVSDTETSGSRASGSLQLGSFGQRRAAASWRHRASNSSVFTSGSIFLDAADNDYPVEVDDADSQGRVAKLRLPRFHDGYGAVGVQFKAGLVQLPWARRLLLSGYLSGHEREVQHNQLMTVPYGEVTYAKRSGGVSLTYAVRMAKGLYLDAVAGTSLRRTLFRDQGDCRYNWRGACVAQLPQRGEIQPQARDLRIDETSMFLRMNFTWLANSQHLVRLSVFPDMVRRTGRDAEIDAEEFDSLAAERKLSQLNSGLEYEARFFDDELRNIVFGKLYTQRAAMDQQLPNGLTQRLRPSTVHVGYGNSLRWGMTDSAYLHASYEWATRLPQSEQLFGDGLIDDNVELQPETSHNFNLGMRVEHANLMGGSWKGQATVFGRLVDNMQVLVGGVNYQQYDNVGAARVYGIGGSSGWSTTHQGLSLNGSVTWQRARNASRTGIYQQFVGEPLPNQPQGSATASLRLAEPGILQANDRLSAEVRAHYVQEFFRGWQSAGRRDSKLTIPDQWLFSAGGSYGFSVGSTRLLVGAELHNLGDSPAFDFFGVQRPGRSFHLKLTVESGRKGPFS